MITARALHSPTFEKQGDSMHGANPVLPEGYSVQDGERLQKSYCLPDDERCEFEVDRDRILHSAAFRRLAGKTQVFSIGQSDFFRSRLTHSLEVAQIAKGIALRVGALPELCEAAALAHDIGHPPFGHKGEDVLNHLMQQMGGFEANAQNFRVLMRLEAKLEDGDGGFLGSDLSSIGGLDLTRGTLDAILKYKRPHASGERKFYYDSDDRLVQWIDNERGRDQSGDDGQSLECQIMDFADDVAYAIHDLEDGVHAGMITHERAVAKAKELKADLQVKVPAAEEADLLDALHQIHKMNGLDEQLGRMAETDRERKRVRKRTTSELIGRAIRSVSAEDRPGTWSSPRYGRRLVVDADLRRLIEVLKRVNFHLLVDDARVHTLESRAGTILEGLFKYFCSDNARGAYPEDFRIMFDQAKTADLKARVACDFIAGMTDQYAERTFNRLFSATRVALFDH